MKCKRHTEEQIIAILKEHEAGMGTADLCRKHGISEATFYNWKAKYGGLEVSEAKRLKALENENSKLKKLLADAMLDNAALKDLLGKKMVTPAAKRDAVTHLQSAFNMSERRACQVVGCPRMTARYQSRRSDDAELRERLKALAHERRRFGYRSLHVLLKREGYAVNHKRLFSLYRLRLSPFASVGVAFFLNTSAYYGEIYRAGLESVGYGQWEAARSTGLTGRQAMTGVLLPQAVRNVLPDLVSNTVEVVKLTSLASAVALPEMLYAADMARSLTYNPSPVVLAGAIYLLLLWPVVRLVSRLEHRLGG